MTPTHPSAGRQTTLRDIAAAVGVDVSTVSKVVNSGAISVRPETRRRILTEVERTGYRPHAAARSLKSKRTGALGLVLPDLANPLYARIARGAVRESSKLGYAMLVAQPTADAPSVLRRLVAERRVDGLIVATARDEDGEQVDALDPTLPFVYVNRRVAGANRSVVVDDEAGAALAAHALLKAGHRRLAFVGGSRTLDTARRRRAGFAAACAEAGVPAPLDVERPYSRSGGIEAARALAGMRERPTGVFASNVLLAIGLLAGLRERGIAVPEEISVVTLDDAEAEYAWPPLTAVRLPFAELGAAAVREIHRVLAGEATRDVTVGPPPRLVERASIAPPR